MGRHRPAPHRRPAVELLHRRTGRRAPWLAPAALAAGGVLACAAAVVVGTAVDDRPAVTGLTRAGSITAAPVPAPLPQEVQAAPAAPPTTEPPAAPPAPARRQIAAEPGPAPVDRAPDRVVRQAPPAVTAPAPVDPAPVLPPPVRTLPLPEPLPSTQPRPDVPPPAVPVDDDVIPLPVGSGADGEDRDAADRDAEDQDAQDPDARAGQRDTDPQSGEQTDPTPVDDGDRDRDRDRDREHRGDTSLGDGT